MNSVFKNYPCRLSASILLMLSAGPMFGQQKWERIFGGSGRDQAFGVVPTADGGYAIGGFTGSFGPGCYSPYVVKTNAWGDTVWTRCYGGYNNDYCWSIEPTRDSGLVLVGAIDSVFQTGPHDVYIVKTNARGDTAWSKIYGDTSHVASKNDVGKDVKVTADGGYIVVGSTSSYGAGGMDVYLIRTNSGGDSMWTRTYGGSNNDYGNAVFPTRDSGYVIAGGTTSYGAGGMDVYLIKTNSRGDTMWTRTFGGAANDEGYSVQPTSDGGFIIAGATGSFGAGGGDVYLIKTNAAGNLVWSKTFGRAYPDAGYSVQPTLDGGYIVAGQLRPSANPNECSAYLIKTNSQGDSLWSRQFTGASGANGKAVRQTQDRGYIVAAITWGGGTDDDFYLIKTDSTGSTGVEEEEADPRSSILDPRLRIHPNPFRNRVTITFNSADQRTSASAGRVSGHQQPGLNIYDAAGRVVRSFNVGSLLVAHRSLLVTWDGRDGRGNVLPAGVYFVGSPAACSVPQRIVKLR